MLSIEQIRAARALLDWSQSDLAEHADLSQTGIARIENGTNQPNSKTLAKIHTAFDKADIEFFGTTGLRKKTGEVKIYRGTVGFKTFMDDVYEQAKTVGGEICLFNGMPRYFVKHLGQEWYDFHANRMDTIKDKFTLRITVKRGEQLLIASDFAEYRWFPEHLFHEKTFYAYGGKLAFMSFSDEEDGVEIRVLPQSDFAESFRILFNIAWEQIATLPEEGGQLSE